MNRGMNRLATTRIFFVPEYVRKSVVPNNRAVCAVFRYPIFKTSFPQVARLMEVAKILTQRFSNRLHEKLPAPYVARLPGIAIALCFVMLLAFAADQLAVGQELQLPTQEALSGNSPNADPSLPTNSAVTAVQDSTTHNTSTEADTLRRFLTQTATDDKTTRSLVTSEATPIPLEDLPTTTLQPAKSNLFQIAPTEQRPIKASPLSLTDLEALAFDHNPTLAAAKARLNATRGQQIQAGLYPNPLVGYQGMEMGIRGTAGQQGGFIGQRFIMGGKLKLDQAAASKQVTATHFEFHAQEMRILSDVRIRFHEAVILQQRVKLTNELVRIGDELVRATEQLLTGRQATQNDLLLAEIQVDESRILFDNSTNEETQSWRRLAAVIGLPAMQPVPLTHQRNTEPPSLDWNQCYATVMDNNPVLNAARLRVDRARILLQRAKKEPIPDIDLMVAHRHHNVTNENVTTVQAGFPLPLFNRNQGNIRSAEAQWLAATKDRERIELELQDRLAVAYRRYTNAIQQTQRYRDRMIPRARKSLKLVTDGYEKGQVQYLTLLTAQRTYWQVSLSYLDSLKELRTSGSLIEGQLLSDSLKDRK